MNTPVHNELIVTLLNQSFEDSENEDAILQQCKNLAQAYVNVDHCVAVLSDFRSDKSYIYAGSFGSFFGFDTNPADIDSAFEDCIFNKVHPDDLTDRHILELSFFQFQKGIAVAERPKYSTQCRIRVRNLTGEYSYINHRTIYVKSLADSSVWLALCLYAPSADAEPYVGIGGKIINNENGRVILSEKYRQYGRELLSAREIEILSFAAKGFASKQIAAQLGIAIHTVNRHRQNIIAKMQVANTSEAVKTAISMGVISAAV